MVERATQVLAELSLSPEFSLISERLLQLNMNGQVLLALRRYQGPEAIRMADIFLVKVVTHAHLSTVHMTFNSII